MQHQLDRRRRHPDEAQTKLERWVLENGGTGEVCKLLGVTRTAVVSWISPNPNNRKVPSLKHAVRIMELAPHLTVYDLLAGGFQ